MSRFAVDASVFGPFFFSDETDQLVPNLSHMIADGDCLVPQHWWLESTIQLLSGLRRGRTESAVAADLLKQIECLPIETDSHTGEQFQATFALAEKHGLTVYDAAYLELALREKCTLVSYDHDLRSAALAEFVAILPEP